MVLELENSIFEKLFKMHVEGQNGFVITSQVSQTALGPIYDLQKEFGVKLGSCAQEFWSFINKGGLKY